MSFKKHRLLRLQLATTQSLRPYTLTINKQRFLLPSAEDSGPTDMLNANTIEKFKDLRSYMRIGMIGCSRPKQSRVSMQRQAEKCAAQRSSRQRTYLSGLTSISL